MDKHSARARRGRKTTYMIRQSGRPRLVVYKSASHIYAQIIEQRADGDAVLASASTVDKELKQSLDGDKKQKAQSVGKLLAERAKKVNVGVVAFDRRGYKYHGRVKALADAAREGGLDF
tara:strand:+ start:144 stop:500 length:357 start_codon:yes stop_codon:yes gene_type:complete